MLIETTENRELWINKVSLEESLINNVKNSDILFLPTKYRDIDNGFFTTATDFFSYIKEKENILVDICINDDSFQSISLNSREFRLGKILIKDIAIPIFVAVATQYFINHLNSSPTEDKVSISLIIEKENGNYKFDYEGNVENFIKIEQHLNNKGHNSESTDNSSNKLQKTEI